jgi:CDP-diacylglycerol--glycerol-3-phosphate 3-phosphatidyltransferase
MSDRIRRQLPNALTVLRLVLAGAFFASLNAFRYPAEHVGWGNLAIVLFITAVITDAFDGHLARKWHAESVFGRIMDPFCDKVLILGAFIYLIGPRFTIPERITEFHNMATGVYPWMVMLILARELLVTGIRGVIESMGFSAASKWSGKAKMILQSIAIPIVLFLTINFQPSQHGWASWINFSLVYLTLIVTLWSGLPYVLGLQTMLVQQARAARQSALAQAENE